MRDRVEVWLDDPHVGADPARVGELLVSRGRTHVAVRFHYDRQWLAPGGSGFAIDPELPLGEGDYFPRTGHTLHGALRDTTPDRWGRRLNGHYDGNAETYMNVGEAMGRAMVEMLED